MAKDDVGRIYTVHLEVPLGDDGNGGRSRAQHYTGWAKNVRERVKVHRRARPATVHQGPKKHRGSKLLAHANVAGVAWWVVDIRLGTYADERRMKANGGAWRRCPECNPRLRREKAMPEITRVHESSGNVGIMSAKMFTFCCGGCSTGLETFAVNLEDAKGDAKDAGWTNGRRRDLAVMPLGSTVESTWRCGDCSRRIEEQAKSREPVPVGAAAPSGGDPGDDEAWDDLPF